MSKKPLYSKFIERCALWSEVPVTWFWISHANPTVMMNRNPERYALNITAL